MGTWLKASALSTLSSGKTVKELVDAMMTAPRQYHGGFATAAFKAGAARGQFKKDPLPPAPAGKEGDKNDTLVLVGVVGTKLEDKNVHSRSPGDMYGAGCVTIAAFLNTTSNDYSIRYRIGVNTSDPDGPTEVLLAQGYDVPLTLVNGGDTWTKHTVPDANVTIGYMYEITGSIPATYKALMNGMLAAPQAFSAVLITNYFDLGALRGWFVNSTLAGENGCAIV
ncbi:unnamed protein product [Closterium sp. Yama58-4]|nr:unnamed protein product [Closterium sp. Yama58-4]